MSDRSRALEAAELSVEKGSESWRRGEEHWHSARPAGASVPPVQPPHKVFVK